MGKETEKKQSKVDKKTHRNKADENRKKTEKCRVGNHRKQGHKQSKQNKPTEERLATTYFGQLLSRSHFLWKNVKVLEKMPFPLGNYQNNV